MTGPWVLPRAVIRHEPFVGLALWVWRQRSGLRAVPSSGVVDRQSVLKPAHCAEKCGDKRNLLKSLAGTVGRDARLLVSMSCVRDARRVRDGRPGHVVVAVQWTAARTDGIAIEQAQFKWTELWNLVLTQDAGNQNARADVAIDGQVLLANVPVTTLLFLDKQVAELETFVTKLPTPDPAEEWTHDPNSGLLKSNASESVRTAKEPAVFVKYEATKEHPAQTEFYMRTADGREPQLDLIRAKVKGDKRDLENLDELFKTQAMTGLISIPIQRWEIAHGVYRFTLGASLEPGEYAMAEVVQGGATSLYFWDFGVDGNSNPAASPKPK